MKSSTINLIKSIPWDKLEDAYGSSVSAPESFVDLLGEDEGLRDNAVDEFLLSSAFHQYSTYSCTPYVVRIVLHIIENENISSLETIGKPLLSLLLGFINVCTHGAKSDLKLKQEIIKGKNIYMKANELVDNDSAKNAKELLEFCLNISD